MFTNRQIQYFVNCYLEYCYLLGFLIGLYGFRFNRVMLPISCLLWLTFFNQQLIYNVDWYLADFHLFNPVQFLFLGWFFYRAFDDVKLKKIVLYVLGGSMIFAIINGIFLQPLSEYPSNFIIVENLLLIIGATFLFIEKLDSPAKENIFKSPVFIVTIAILSFNIFSFVYFLLVSYFNKHKIDEFSSIIRILFFANIIYYSLLIVGLLFSIKKTKQVAKS